MKIEAVSTKIVKTKRGDSPTYAFKGDDGQWYNVGFDNPEVMKGDEVQFDFESTKFGNKVAFESFKVVKRVDGAATPTGDKPPYARKAFGAPQQSRPFPIPLLHGDRAIVRQNALTNARELYTAGVLVFNSAPDSDTAVKQIVAIARQFEAYSCGDVEQMDAENVHKKHLTDGRKS